MIDLEPATSTPSGLVEGVRDDQLSVPTPCAGTSLGDLLDHVDGLSRAFTAAAAKTPIDGAPSADASRGSRRSGRCRCWRSPASTGCTTRAHRYLESSWREPPGCRWPTCCARAIFEPLGMRDTAFWAADTARLATAYAPSADGLQVWDPPDGQWSRPPAFGDAAAGLVSTADDLLAFARMLLRGGDAVLSTEAVAEMTRDQLTPEQKARSGPGVLHGRSWAFCQSVVTEGPYAGAFGWDGGLGTSWLVDPRRELTVIVLTQRLFETRQAPQVHRDLQAAALAALG